MRNSRFGNLQSAFEDPKFEMPPLVCPQCKNTNPDAAAFCYFDGMNLKAGAGSAAPANSLASPFVFPSGRSCGTFDELVQGCQEEWTASRDMLGGGVFQQFFTSAGRMDLVKACQDAQKQEDPDIGLSQLLGAMPATAAVRGPKLDINPRRLSLGKVMAGQTRKIPFKIINTGQGILQGTLSIAEGNEWLKMGASSNGQASVKTTKDQQIPLVADTRGLAAGEPYAAKLRIITNGGAQEVPIRIDVGAHPYPKPPFNGAKSPRDMAVKMKNNPKAAAALLESGDLPKWFASNSWTYPIGGTPAKGVAGVQQFFESMGLAKPPQVKVTHPEVRLVCKVPERPRFQVKLVATSKKYVYANVRCDAPWLNILTPSVTGPQQAAIAFEIEPRMLPKGKQAETVVQYVANGNQKLTTRVRLEIQRPADSPIRRLLQGIVVMGLAFFMIRLFAAPVVDLYARSSATSIAATRSVSNVQDFSPARSLAGWLRLPWLAVFLGYEWKFPDDFLGEGQKLPEPNSYNENFRDYFVGSFARTVIMLTWWIGAVVGAGLLFRRSGFFDGIWGLLSGGVMGIVCSASLACVLLIIDLIPGTFLYLIQGNVPDLIALFIWIILTVLFWTAFGAGLGLLLKLLGPIGRPFLVPVQDAFAGFFRLCGLRAVANFCASQ